MVKSETARSDNSKEKIAKIIHGICISEEKWQQLFSMWRLLSLVGPFKQELQRLATRHKNDPVVFVEKAMRMLDRKFKKMGLPISFHQLWQEATNWKPATNTLSKRQVDASNSVLDIVAGAFQKSGKAGNSDPRKALKLFHSLLAERPGPRPSGTSLKIIRIYDKAQASGRHLTDGDIARLVYPDYASLNGEQKRHSRECIRLVIRDYQAKG